MSQAKEKKGRWTVLEGLYELSLDVINLLVVGLSLYHTPLAY